MDDLVAASPLEDRRDVSNRIMECRGNVEDLTGWAILMSPGRPGTLGGTDQDDGERADKVTDSWAPWEGRWRPGNLPSGSGDGGRVAAKLAGEVTGPLDRQSTNKAGMVKDAVADRRNTQAPGRIGCVSPNFCGLGTSVAMLPCATVRRWQRVKDSLKTADQAQADKDWTGEFGFGSTKPLDVGGASQACRDRSRGAWRAAPRDMGMALEHGRGCMDMGQGD